MKLRTAILWQPGGAGRFGLLVVSVALVLLLAYLHTLAGLAYEFHVFFAAPLALVAWFLGLRWGLAAAILVVALWLRADQTLGGDPASALPLALKETLIEYQIVIPAKAGIQANQGTGHRLSPV